MPPVADVETLVIGAGVVGLATGAALAHAGQSVVVAEREKLIGQSVSARNSEVIHAGIYYPPGSLKAKLCLRGRELLYAYCEKRKIPHQRIGKLIVATEVREIETLEQLAKKGLDNGVHDLVALKATEAMARQPGLMCTAALHSPSTGIVDSHSLMTSLHADIDANGGNVACQTEVSQIDRDNHLFQIKLTDGSTITAANVINSCGLHSVPFAHKINSLDSTTIPKARFAKGNYFRLATHAPFSKLIYPAPVVGGLGIHLTIDLAGQKRFGPDVEWLPASNSADYTPEVLDNFTYQVSDTRLSDFYTAIRRYWPDLPDDSLVPDYAGIRPKIEWPDATPIDFAISTEQQHGITGLVNLYGIESPGLTSSLAIAEHVRNILI